MGKNLATGGTLSVGGMSGLKGGAYVRGSFSFEDYEETSKKDPTRKRPIASAGTKGSRIAYIGVGQTATGSTDLGTSYAPYLSVRGQFPGGDTYATNKFYSASVTSDIRLKENVKDSEVKALETIERMKVRQFDWRENGWHQNIGFVADELEKVDPNLALGGGYDENGEMNVKQINTPYLLNYAVKAIQELSETVKNQNKHIEELERRLS